MTTMYKLAAFVKPTPAWTCRQSARPPNRTSFSYPMMEDGLCADSVEKHEPASDIDTVATDSLKVLDPYRPIREVDIDRGRRGVLVVL